MEKKETYKRFPRRKLDKTDICVPDCSLSVRVLIDRTSKGLPVNARLTKHIPLPDDGLISDDWETGTEEILDVTDAVVYADKIRSEQEHIAKEKEKAHQDALGKTETATDPQEKA